ncbi:MAG: tetratricopeptide repeat protein [Planctomycetota bacterium]|nr:tetratricopeptide repeat protein [Planctomycetota bacterium]
MGQFSATPTAAPVAKSKLSSLVDRARADLEREDPMAALQAFQEVRVHDPDCLDGLLGMAETYLFLGKPKSARSYVELARRKAPRDQRAMALHVRILIRDGKFDSALRMSKRGMRQFDIPGVELLSAHASALFRVQRTADAAGVYQRVLKLDPFRPEAHLRLGSGLLPPRVVPYVHSITLAIRARTSGNLILAEQNLAEALQQSPAHPIAHRLLGEVLYEQRYWKTMVAHSEAYKKFASAMPVPCVEDLPVTNFLPGFKTLSPERKKVAARALCLFGSLLPKLVAIRGRHDFLRADERTTDAVARANLRGKRTFDGRVWDDVRGIGGLQAATGIESLDEAAQFGFDTLTHEIAHQAHLYAFKPVFRAKIRALYKAARRSGRCLDFYAATNDAEYFGQGVEAYVALAKRPGCEKTHGHTRFELKRQDPALYDFIASIIEFDPLRDSVVRGQLLTLAVELALLRGCPEDAVTAAEMLDQGSDRASLLAMAQKARRDALNY